MDFTQNYFQIFALPEAFDLDPGQLSERYLLLQKSVHPDKFAGVSDKERRLAMQWTTQINSAYATLKSPLPRAIYLLGLQDVSIKDNPALDPMFLMEQIELREELEEIEAGDTAIEKLEAFKRKAKTVMKTLEADFAEAFSTAQMETAESAVYKMQFMNKLLVAADQLEEKILDY